MHRARSHLTSQAFFLLLAFGGCVADTGLDESSDALRRRDIPTPTLPPGGFPSGGSSSGGSGSSDDSGDDPIVRDHRGGADVWEGEAGPVQEWYAYLHAGEEAVFETRGSTSRSNPVLHLLSYDANRGDTVYPYQRAMDDDGGPGTEARIAYTPSSSGWHILVLRAADGRSAGRTDVYRDGTRWRSNAEFGGWFVRLPNLKRDESLRSLALPKGPRRHTLYLLGSSGSLWRRIRSDGTETASYRMPYGSTRTALVGTRRDPGPARLVLNDVLFGDADGDGLGDALEESVGTCSRKTGFAGGFECSRVTDPRDTDGDGISDGLELVGRLDVSPPQSLPRWGANPRHKDIFVEVDFMRRNTSETDSHMPAEVARKVAGAYGDPETDPIFRLYHAQTLDNPDLEPGISLHFDTGVDPDPSAPASEYALYGDWGGHDAVPPICDGGDCKGKSAEAAYGDYMDPSRRGLFHYALAYDTGGGQAPHGVVWASFNQADAGNTAHEFGHTLGLGHSQPFWLGAFVDPNCKPNYPSLMSYAYLHSGPPMLFSDGWGRPALDNTALRERGAVRNPGTDRGALYLDDLERRFGYRVDLGSGDVDWNRDGIFSPGTVRAYANDHGGACEFTRYDGRKLTGRTFDAPSLVRLGEATFLFRAEEGGELRFSRTESELDCQVPQASGCGDSWSEGGIGGDWNSGVQAFDVHRIVEGGHERLLLVYADAWRNLWEVRLRAHGNGLRADGPPRRVPGTANPDGLSLAGSESLTWIAYRGSSGFLRMNLRDNAHGVWGDELVVRDLAGDAIEVPLGTAPAIVQPEGEGMLYGAFATGGGRRLEIWTMDPAVMRWEQSIPGRTGAAEGRPGLAWVPFPEGYGMEGRLYVLYHRPDGPLRDAYTLVDPSGTLRLGMDGDFDNGWLHGHGADLLFEPGVDTNLRAAFARRRDDHADDGAVYFRPAADGILDHTLRDWNDWETLRVGACRTLVYPKNLDAQGVGGAEPIHCPPWP